MNTLLSALSEIYLSKVLNAGEPNKECVLFSPTVPVDIGRYAVILGIRTPNPAFILPLRDAFFWFGSVVIQPTDWIFLYTGSGTPRKARTADNTGDLHVTYWNRPTTLFHDPQVVPAIVRLDGLVLPPAPTPLPQLPPS